MKGDVNRIGQILHVQLDGYGAMYFMKKDSKKQIWYFIPPEQRVVFFHPEWTGKKDTLLFNESQTQACRLKNGSCADVVFSPDTDKMTLYWHGKKTIVEVFEKKKGNFYLFEKEQITN